ncbi:MAG: hypothetical protein HY391_03330, partial [Deltaproteobacteria bacterium]|nr:hypothetical protein [Deltaproteobacteria bacterium]
MAVSHIPEVPNFLRTPDSPEEPAVAQRRKYIQHVEVMTKCREKDSDLPPAEPVLEGNRLLALSDGIGLELDMQTLNHQKKENPMPQTRKFSVMARSSIAFWIAYATDILVLTLSSLSATYLVLSFGFRMAGRPSLALGEFFLLLSEQHFFWPFVGLVISLSTIYYV